MTTESILEEAQRLIHGERNQNYGHPRENFKNIARLFSGYLDREISDIDVANLMILVKVARVQGGPYHRDSFTDIAGYAGCVGRIYEETPEIPDGPPTFFVGDKVPELGTPEPEPRVWTDVNDIPWGVIFTPEGSLQKYRVDSDNVLRVMLRHPGGSEWSRSNHDDSWLYFAENHSPFTEVV